VRSLLASAAIVAAVALAGCQTDGALPTSGKAMAPLSEKMVAEIDRKNMDKDSPILIRTFKQESELEVWKQDRTGRYALLKTYPICRWSGELGPKIKEGDRQAPEGFYTITPGQMNPNSQFYLSFDLGYPNSFDRAHGRTGGNLMVHGDCSSRGCYSMTDEQVAEIYALGREAFFGGQRAFQVQAYPFKMTPQNLAKHRNNPHLAFWKMLKRGYDHFEVTRLEPKVNVCEKHYVFDAESPDPLRPISFNPSGKCPAYVVSEEIVTAVQEKERRDDAQYAELVRRGTPTVPALTYADGGMHQVFVDAVKRNQVGVRPQSFSLASQAPGTIPVTVRPPRIPELADAPIMEMQGPPPAPATARAAAPSTTPARTAAAATSTTPDTTTDTKSTGGSIFGRMARMVGFSSEEAAPPPKEQPAAVTKPKPAPRPARTKPPETVAAVRTDAPAPAKTAVAAKPASAFADPPPPPPAPKPAANAAVPAAPAQAQAGGLTGAAPVVPSGNFENRWSAFR